VVARRGLTLCFTGLSVRIANMNSILKSNAVNLAAVFLTTLIAVRNVRADQPASCDFLDAQACHRAAIGSYFSLNGERPKSFDFLVSGCKHGDAFACAIYARFIKKGQVPGVSKFAEYFGSAQFGKLVNECKKKDGGSCFAAAVAVSEGLAESNEEGAGPKFYSQACDLGTLAACNNLGVLYSFPGVGQSFSKSNALFSRLCNSGFGPGCVNLGAANITGHGVPQSTAKAMELFEKACSLKTGVGCLTLGLMYAQAQGVEKSSPKALSYFTRACTLDDRDSCHNVGVLLYNDKDLMPAGMTTFEAWTRNCELGYASDCGSVGILYWNAKGVELDRDKAIQYWDRACKSGDSDSCHNREVSQAWLASQKSASSASQTQASAPDFSAAFSILGSILPGGAGSLIKKASSVSKVVEQISCSPTGCLADVPWFEDGHCYLTAAEACSGKAPGCAPVKCP